MITTEEADLLFLDLDGVLADFVGGACAWHGKENPYDNGKNLGKWGFDRMLGMSRNQFWEALDYDFWRGLKPTAEFDAIVNNALANFRVDQIYILTSASLRNGCCDGKRDWVRYHLPQINPKHLIFTSEKHLLAAPSRILVDDYDHNIEQWRERGGNAVRVNRPWNRGYDSTGIWAAWIGETT